MIKLFSFVFFLIFFRTKHNLKTWNKCGYFFKYLVIICVVGDDDGCSVKSVTKKVLESWFCLYFLFFVLKLKNRVLLPLLRKNEKEIIITFFIYGENISKGMRKSKWVLGNGCFFFY